MKKDKLDVYTLVVLAATAFIIFTGAITVIYSIKYPYRPYSNYFGQDGSTFNMREYLTANGWENVQIVENAIQDHGPYDEGSVPCIYATSPFGNKLHITGENILVTDCGHPIYSERMKTSDIDYLISIDELNPNCKMYSGSVETLDSLIKSKRF